MHAEMLHIRRESVSQYLEKHVRYADMESDEWLKWKLGRSPNAPTGELFKDALRWRQWVRRNIWPRLPARALWRFIYMYFFRFGFLDGNAGWHLAELMACYEYMITLLYRDKLIAGLPSNVRVAYGGVVAPDEVTAVLRRHHLFFLPTHSENFGHVIVEALAAGRPALVSDRTPWTDLEAAGAFSPGERVVVFQTGDPANYV